MGLWSKIKGWLNIGGVKVQILETENPFPEDDPVMKGRFSLTTKTDATILSTSVEFYAEETKVEGEEEKTEKTVFGSMSTEDYLINEDYPFELKAGESKELSFLIINVDVGGYVGRLAKKGGVLGAVGKVAKFAGKLDDGEIEYFVEVTADVKGMPFDPTDKVEIKVVPGASK